MKPYVRPPPGPEAFVLRALSVNRVLLATRDGRLWLLMESANDSMVPQFTELDVGRPHTNIHAAALSPDAGLMAFGNETLEI